MRSSTRVQRSSNPRHARSGIPRSDRRVGRAEPALLRDAEPITPVSRSDPMKAVRFSQFGGPEVLEILDLPDPHPKPGQVRVAVRAAGVNPSDWKKRQGLM